MFSVVSAQDAEEDVPDRKNGLRPGSWSIQFRISPNFKLDSFEGTVISIKRHHSAKSAFRLGVSLDLEYTVSEIVDFRSIRDTTLSYAEINDNMSGYNVEVDLKYMRYPSPGSMVNLFWGVGPLVRFSRLNNERTRALPPVISESNTTGWAVGAGATIGAEWFATKSISFHCEYGGSIVFVHSTREQRLENLDSGYISRNYQYTHRWIFEPREVLFGISAYF